MKQKTLLTVESVTEGHPDKLCDLIADKVLDACLEKDRNARVACEVMATAGKITVAGEITASELPDIAGIISETVREVGYSDIGDYEIEVLTHDQSEDISGAVDKGTPGILGAGDQGIMYGYATSETGELLPVPVVIAHRITSKLTAARKDGLISGLRPDGKAQVTVEYRYGIPHRIDNIVVSCQHDEDKKLEDLKREILTLVVLPSCIELKADLDTAIRINPSGRFVRGGFEADTGLTGRKLMVDTYGGLVPHGGGALSGKDPTKVDRSGAYMARYIAKTVVAAELASRCTVSLAYAIGCAEPVAVDVDTYDTGEYPDDTLVKAIRAVFDLTPAGIIREVGLDYPFYAQTTNYGHFTKQYLPWEQADRILDLIEACEELDAEELE